ncbi:hypothetical protein GGR50DRAFT_685713 [Xylaria sp. CBS 124048]|nr:hypothetical protein GGR50DRAFT_685713 [Xylaria sp. CBS 124048]
MPRPSTAASIDPYYGHSISDLLEPAMDGPPSPEGIRAFSRRVKRGSIIEQHNHEQATSSSPAPPLDFSDILGERSLENSDLSRNPSQRSQRPDSVQLFGKGVFSRRPKLRREQSDQSYLNNPLRPLTEVATNSAPDPSREPRFIQSMFTRRARGASEASQKKFQISGPYDFQHLSHSSKDNMPSAVERSEPISNFQGARPRTTTGSSVTLDGFYLADKALPKAPGAPEDFERHSPRGSIQMSPPFLPTPTSDDAQITPIAPLSRSSGRPVRHDRGDSFAIPIMNRTETDSSYLPQTLVFSPNDGFRPSPASQVSNDRSEQHVTSSEELSPYSSLSANETAWPLTGSMSSLPQVPEEEECQMNGNNTSHMTFQSNSTSLRGSMSVPQLRRVSSNKVTHRSPSNASDTLGRYQVISAQQAIYEYEYENERANEDSLFRHSWEDDIDYCYDHAAEADCDFAWERPSCDFEREDYFAQSSVLSPAVGLAPPLRSLPDAPELSPSMSNSSASTQRGVVTPTGSAVMPITSNFSLPKIDTSFPLKRDSNPSRSSSSSFQEMPEFHLSPSLLIPNDDYHEKMLHFERGDLSGEPSIALPNDQYLTFAKTDAFVHARSSASTITSTLSEQSVASSRYPSSSFTRWTGSSTSSWQTHVDSQQAGVITLDDKDCDPNLTTDVTIVSPSESPVASLPHDFGGREGHSRTQSAANFLTKMNVLNKVTPSKAKAANETPKLHRRTRTASKSHANVSPSQFPFFPQGVHRP